VDIGDSPFRAEIEWIADQGITGGCAPDRFCPRDPVTRGQLASFLTRALDLPPTASDFFSDDDSSQHESAINRIAAAGIAAGCAEDRFCPGAVVTRAQMATFLARAFDVPRTSSEFFIDVWGLVHEQEINDIADAGISGGCGPRRYCPRTSVTREQMAAFLRRAIVEHTRISAPPALAMCSWTLQAAVDATPSGSRMVVPPCTYRETVTIRKPLTLVTDGGRIDGQGVRKHAFVVSGSDVTIDGFEVTRTTNPAQDGAIRVRAANRFTLRNTHIHHTGGACISIGGGSGHRILDSELAYCAQQGYHLAGVSDSLVARTSIHHNNPNRAYDPGWEAGAGKAAGVVRLTFEANEVYANRGHGLWCDVECRHVTYRGNRVHHNELAGIYFEISDGALIVGNRVWENGWAFPPWGWGGGIVVSSSRNVVVEDNVVAWNADGISVISQNRGRSTWNSVTNVAVRDNVVVLAPQAVDGSDRMLLAWLQDWNGVMYRSTSNNRGLDNRYWHSQSEPTWGRYGWEGPISRLSTFNATPGEQGGVYISTATRDAILASAGMPLSPQAR
jgi:hypothetical protein